MLTPDDFEVMKDAYAEMRGDREMSLVLRRGDTVLTAQRFRVAGKGSGSRRETNRVEEARGQIALLGAVGADIQPRDRFTLDGRVYQVIFVRPNRDVATMADAEVAE